MSLIYEPKGRAREYAALALNIYRGCDHNCSYCYAPLALRMDREQFATPTQRNEDFLQQLEREAAQRQPAEPILLCFTCDPYQRLDVTAQLTRHAIKILHRHNHAVHVLTKGGSRALRDIDLFRPTDAFATTLTCLDEATSTQWEPGAASPDDRIATIKGFHDEGIPTWVSLEPVLSPADALEIIRRTHGFVDLYKVGKLNYRQEANLVDWAQFAHDAVELLESLGCKYLIKEDLKGFLNSDGADAVPEVSNALTPVTATQVVTRTPDTLSPGQLTTKELDERIKTAVADCNRHVESLSKAVRDVLYPALLEMESRFEKKQGVRNDLKKLKVEGWHEYLLSRGVTPATFRKWKSRNAINELQGRVCPSEPKENKGKKDVQPETLHVEDTEASLLAKAGVRMANTMVNQLIPEGDRVKKVTEYAEQIVEAAACGTYQNLAEPAAQNREPKLKVYEVVGKGAHATPTRNNPLHGTVYMLLLAKSEEEALKEARQYDCFEADPTVISLSTSLPILLIPAGNRKGNPTFDVKYAQYGATQKRVIESGSVEGDAGAAPENSVQQ